MEMSIMMALTTTIMVAKITTITAIIFIAKIDLVDSHNEDEVKAMIFYTPSKKAQEDNYNISPDGSKASHIV